MTVQSYPHLSRAIKSFRDKRQEIKEVLESNSVRRMVELGMFIPPFVYSQLVIMDRVEAAIVAEPTKGYSDRINSAAMHIENLISMITRAQLKVLTAPSTFHSLREKVELLGNISHKEKLTADLRVFRDSATSEKPDVGFILALYFALLSNIETANRMAPAERIKQVLTPPPAKRRKGKTRRYVMPGEKRVEAPKKNGKKQKQNAGR